MFETEQSARLEHKPHYAGRRNGVEQLSRHQSSASVRGDPIGGSRASYSPRLNYGRWGFFLGLWGSNGLGFRVCLPITFLG